MSDCKKVKFANERAANEYIDKLQKTSTRKVVPLRAYLCPYCTTWHLTSRKEYFDSLKENFESEVAKVKADCEKKLSAKGDDVLKMQVKLNNLKEQGNKERAIITERNNTVSELRAEIKRLNALFGKKNDSSTLAERNASEKKNLLTETQRRQVKRDIRSDK